jgi:putative colanic acid biosynthesis glycosyltransferase
VVDGDVEPDNGIYDAMNNGIARAMGEYIIFMNAGDMFGSAETLKHIAQYDADFIYGNDLSKRTKHHSKINYGMITHHQAMIYRREIIGDLRYDETYHIAADYKFTLEFIRRCNSIYHIQKTICIFENGGISQQNAKQGRLEQIAIRRDLNISAPFTPCRQWVGQIVKRLTSR